MVASLVSQIKVEIAFGYQPDNPSPVYTNVTAYLRAQQGVTISRGRSDELSQVTPSRLTLTLANTDGRFTAGYTAGAYYPNVKPGVLVRVSTISPATTRFTGEVDEWPTEWDQGKWSFVTITATDRSASLGNPLRSVLEQEILADIPDAYFTLGESSGSTTAGDTSTIGSSVLSVAQLGSGGTLTFGSGTGPTDSLPAAQFAPTNTTNGKYLAGPLADTTACTVECWFSTSTVAAQDFLVLYGTPGFREASFGIDASGKLTAFAKALSAGDFTATSSGSVADGLVHQAMLVQELSGLTTINCTLYLDGAQIATGSMPTTLGARYVWQRLTLGGGDLSTVFNGTLSHVSLYSDNGLGARAAAHYAAGSTGFAGDSSDEWIARIAGYAGIATGDQVLETGSSTSLQTISTAGQSPLTAMQAVTDTEGGVLFIDATGKLNFQARSHRYNTTAVVTLAGTSLSTDTKFVTNRTYLKNDVTASRNSGVTYRAVNQTSIDDYRRARDSITLLTTSDNEVIDAANWRANVNGTPSPRLPNMKVDLTKANSTLQASILGLKISDRIALSTLPSVAPNSSNDQLIEGWTETWGAESVIFDYNTSPASTGTVWVLDSASFSQLDSTTRLAY